MPYSPSCSPPKLPSFLNFFQYLFFFSLFISFLSLSFPFLNSMSLYFSSQIFQIVISSSLKMQMFSVASLFIQQPETLVCFLFMEIAKQPTKQPTKLELFSFHLRLVLCKWWDFCLSKANSISQTTINFSLSS